VVRNGRDDGADSSNRRASEHEAFTIEGELGRLLDWHAYALWLADEEGVSPFDIQILRLLLDQRGARASSLAEEFGVTRTTISRHVALLTKEGLIDQHPDPADGRAVQLQITAAGRAELTVYEKRRRKFIRLLTTDWSENERQLVAACLARLNLRGREFVEQNLRPSRTAGAR
jgi:DNA-binding MarR family transcriptional regulator